MNLVGARSIESFNRLTPTAKRLIACRALRSVGQGALVVDFALYLNALRWSAVDIGAVYMGGLMLGAVLTLISGPISDRSGRKPFLFGYGVAQAIAALIALVATQPLLLILAAVTGAFGRGANGAAGPFGPVEQAWLSENLSESDFGAVYSVNAAVGFFGMAAGALIGALPAIWSPWLPGALAYRPLFLLTLVGALATLWLLPKMSEAQAPSAGARSKSPREPVRTERSRTRLRLLIWLMGVNAVNGLSAGVIGPFMAYWFKLRYGVGPGAIGPAIALSFVLSSAASIWTAWLSRRLGSALSVVVTRAIGVALLAILPFAPNFSLAAACYVLRAAFNRGSIGARTAVGLKLGSRRRRGLAASLNAISMQVPRALGPMLGGVLLDADMLALPMLIAAALQLLYLTLYGIIFRGLD